MRHGIPFDVAFSLETGEAVAWAVNLGEQLGGTFDWDTMQWKKPKG